MRVLAQARLELVPVKHRHRESGQVREVRVRRGQVAEELRDLLAELIRLLKVTQRGTDAEDVLADWLIGSIPGAVLRLARLRARGVGEVFCQMARDFKPALPRCL